MHNADLAQPVHQSPKTLDKNLQKLRGNMSGQFKNSNHDRHFTGKRILVNQVSTSFRKLVRQ